MIVLAILLARRIQDSPSLRPVPVPPAEEWFPGLIRSVIVDAGASPAPLLPVADSPGTWRIEVEPSFPLPSFSESLSRSLQASSLVASVTAPAGWSDDTARFAIVPAAPDAAPITLIIERLRRPPPTPTEPTPRPTPPPSRSARPSRPRVAIVIDDLGVNRELSLRAVGLAAPVTVAVIPLLPLSTEIARAAAARKKEVLMHVPMEPKDPEKDPGPGVLLGTMDRGDITRALQAELASVPGAVGINNHMGSQLTTDPRAMDDVLAWVAERGFIFLDSMTAPDSIAGARARRLGLRSFRRDVFLDNVDEPEAIRERLEELASVALRHGTAIAIGHPRANTLSVLETELARLASRGIDLVPLSGLAP